jgi:hypothetical protein
MVVPTERRGRALHGEVETVCLYDPERANEQMLVNVPFQWRVE